MKFAVVFGIFASIVCFTYGKPGFMGTEQEWGYVEVRPGAHIFWWMFYTTADVPAVTDRPLVIWLQGGPGASSTGYGNFAELGPFTVDVEPRNWTWVRDCNVMFVDNPVGTGYSYVESDNLLTTTNLQIALDLVEMLRGFYAEFPQFETVPLYITSESYGGKMAAEIGLELDKAIKAGTINSNFIGVALGDSWVSPIDSVLGWAPFLWNVGAIDMAGYKAIDDSAQLTKNAVDAGNWIQATNLWGTTEFVIMDVAKNVDFYNILEKIQSEVKKSPQAKLIRPSVEEDDAKIQVLMAGPVREALEIPANVQWGSQSGRVFQTLAGDFMKPVTEVVEQLLNTTNIKVCVFSGQLDLIVETTGTVVWIDALKWDGATEWQTAPRDAIVYNGINEGYVKKVGNLGLWWVNRAGHMVPADNPMAMDVVLRDLTDNYAKKN